MFFLTQHANMTSAMCHAAPNSCILEFKKKGVMVSLEQGLAEKVYE